MKTELYIIYIIIYVIIHICIHLYTIEPRIDKHLGLFNRGVVALECQFLGVDNLDNLNWINIVNASGLSSD